MREDWRNLLYFKYFFNAGYDDRTGETDLEGSDVFYDGHYVGSVWWQLPDELALMNDFELIDKFVEAGIVLPD